MSELPSATECVYSFWVGHPIETQECTLTLCARCPTVNTLVVFRPARGEYSKPLAGKGSSTFLASSLHETCRLRRPPSHDTYALNMAWAAVSKRLDELSPREYGAWTLEDTMPVSSRRHEARARVSPHASSAAIAWIPGHDPGPAQALRQCRGRPSANDSPV